MRRPATTTGGVGLNMDFALRFSFSWGYFSWMCRESTCMNYCFLKFCFVCLTFCSFGFGSVPLSQYSSFGGLFPAESTLNNLYKLAEIVIQINNTWTSVESLISKWIFFQKIKLKHVLHMGPGDIFSNWTVYFTHVQVIHLTVNISIPTPLNTASLECNRTLLVYSRRLME